MKRANLLSRRALLKGTAAGAVAGSLSFTPACAAVADLAIQATRTALKGDFYAAKELARQSGDGAAIRLVELLYLKNFGSEGGYARIMAFLQAAPNWPLRETLMRRAEKALYDNRESASVVTAHFAKTAPLTPFGALALARVAYAQNDAQAGKRWLVQAWGDIALSTEFEPAVVSEFGSKLMPDDHNMRLWKLVYDLQSGRAQRFAKAHCSIAHQDAARVANALLQYNVGALRLYENLPTAMRQEMALLYLLVRFHRKNENYAQARALFAGLPKDPKAMLDPEAWYEERRVIARRSIGPKQREHWGEAYAIVSNHGLEGCESEHDAEFVSGWIALRYLQDAQNALTHFQNSQRVSDRGRELARAHYWQGRAQYALGNTSAAKSAFGAAAKHSTIYYGQLAREELGLGRQPDPFESLESSEDAKAFVEKDELMRAFRLLQAVGAKDELRMFLRPLAEHFDGPDKLNVVAAIISQSEGPTAALHFAKACARTGIELDNWNYPIYALPSWSQVGKSVEKPLVFALSRQESEFNPSAGSPVGALGLMQLMPSTAKLVAQRYRINFGARDLRDPVTNVTIGAAHLSDLVASYNGSYVLTLVAYNAGPRRASDWVDYYGDLRGGQVDPIDWVECIPFNETRQYVQKVLQNLHMYRSRLAPESVRPMTADLKRGGGNDDIGSITLLIEPGQCSATGPMPSC